MKYFIHTTFLLVIFSFTASSQEYYGNDKDINRILENAKMFSQYYMNGEAKKLADCYTADGKMFPTRSEIIEGTEKIEQYWTPREGTKVLHHKVTAEEIRITDDYAYDYGYYEGETLSDGKNYTFKGKYIIVWRKVDGNWKIYLDMWSGLD